jgi:hypothetical protein
MDQEKREERDEWQPGSPIGRRPRPFSSSSLHHELEKSEAMMTRGSSADLTRQGRGNRGEKERENI